MRWFHGVREHVIITEGGLIAFIHQMPGNRHDVIGLYDLLTTTFTGHLIADSGYWPKPKPRAALAARGITIDAATCKAWHYQNPPHVTKLINEHRQPVERIVGLFNQQFHANRTLCRSPRHYRARRWTKALAHNMSRYINFIHQWQRESLAHFPIAC
jgi:Transposase DDE domain